MLTTDRDSERHGERNAIPSMGELEGRMAVLELVAQCALVHALSEGDKEAEQALLGRIHQAMHSKCLEMKLGLEDRDAAIEFAEQLIRAAIKQARNDSNEVEADASASG